MPLYCRAGAVFAASNAALALAQLGNEGEATAEMQRIARRAPGSADMRAALAALYWSQVGVRSGAVSMSRGAESGLSCCKHATGGTSLSLASSAAGSPHRHCGALRHAS